MDLIDRLRNALEGRYRIERELGHGGMAFVFLAREVKHDRLVALKVLRPELAAAIGAERFHREIAIAAPLVHPHVLPIYDSGEADGLLYYVMPYLQGESLRERLRRRGRLPLEEAVRIAGEVADGLEYAHRQGVVHRDVKPENILLTETHALIADFGVARAVAESGKEGLTSAGFAVGTAAYMSPEQAWGEAEVDARSDVYSLGCVVYEMLTGEPPFPGDGGPSLLARKAAETAPSVRTVRADVPPEMARAVERALSRRPEERFSSALAFARALAGSREKTDEYSVRHPSSEPRGARRWREVLPPGYRIAGVLLALVLLGTAALVVRNRVLEPETAYAVSHPRESFVVLPFRSRMSTPQEDTLAARAADELTRLLNGWMPARAVPAVALAGPMFDLGVSGPTLSGLDDGFRVARAVRVGTLVGLTVRVRGDTALLDAALYDVASRRSLEGSPVQARSVPRDDVYGLVAPVANAILGLSGAPEELEALRRESAIPAAVDHFQEGRRSLERWRLEEAEEHFRAAVERDSSFARAYYYLALTLYWRTARDPNRQAELGPQIAELSAIARRLARSAEPHTLTAAQRDHIEAFALFQSGEYEGARDRYRALLERDSTDVYAWLLLGSVEFTDPWLTGATRETWRPRGNLNLAVRAFSETVRLSPDFSLGYGHLFDIYRKLANAIHVGLAYIFERPGGGVILPWQAREEPARGVPFYPIVLDSIGWVDRASWSRRVRRRSLAGVDSLRRHAVHQLERWAAYAPREPTPREELAAWLLLERRLPKDSITEAELSNLTHRALELTAAALSLRGDTTPEDRVRLAALYLAADSVSRATEMTERALAEAEQDRSTAPSAMLPRAAANLFLARGQPSRVVEILAPWWAVESRAIDDTVQGRVISYGGAEPVVGKLETYGAAGLAGERLRSAFAELDRVWSEPRYTSREVFLLRAYATRRIGPALALDGKILADWFRGQTEISPLWEGFLRLETDPEGARRSLERAAAELGERRPSATTAYLFGLLAQRLGEDSLAVELWSRVDTWPLPVAGFDPGWGLRSLSYLLRARSYEALGDSSAAIRHYERFEEMWADAEPDLRPLVEEARAARRRLQRSK